MKAPNFFSKPTAKTPPHFLAGRVDGSEVIYTPAAASETCNGLICTEGWFLRNVVPKIDIVAQQGQNSKNQTSRPHSNGRPHFYSLIIKCSANFWSLGS